MTDTSTQYRELINEYLDDPDLDPPLTEQVIQDLVDEMSRYHWQARTTIMLNDPTASPEQVEGQTLNRVLLELFLTPFLGMETAEDDFDTVPLPTPAQLLHRIVEEERDHPQRY